MIPTMRESLATMILARELYVDPNEPVFGIAQSKCGFFISAYELIHVRDLDVFVSNLYERGDWN